MLVKLTLDIIKRFCQTRPLDQGQVQQNSCSFHPLYMVSIVLYLCILNSSIIHTHPGPLLYSFPSPYLFKYFFPLAFVKSCICFWDDDKTKGEGERQKNVNGTIEKCFISLSLKYWKTWKRRCSSERFTDLYKLNLGKFAYVGLVLVSCQFLILLQRPLKNNAAFKSSPKETSEQVWAIFLSRGPY